MMPSRSAGSRREEAFRRSDRWMASVVYYYGQVGRGDCPPARNAGRQVHPLNAEGMTMKKIPGMLSFCVFAAVFVTGCRQQEQAPSVEGHSAQKPVGGPTVSDSGGSSAAGGTTHRYPGRREKTETATVRTAEEQRGAQPEAAEGSKALYSKLSAECAKLPESGMGEVEGLETRGWTHETFGNPGSVFVVQKGESGNKMLALVFSGGDKGKTGFGRILDLAAREDGKLSFAAYNPSDAPLTISVALTTGPDHVWHESKPVELKNGWNRVEFDLGANDYKTEASGWKHTSGISKKGEVRGLFLVVNNAGREGHIFVEGIRLDTAAPKPASSSAQPSDQQRKDEKSTATEGEAK